MPFHHLIVCYKLDPLIQLMSSCITWAARAVQSMQDGHMKRTERKRRTISVSIKTVTRWTARRAAALSRPKCRRPPPCLDGWVCGANRFLFNVLHILLPLGEKRINYVASSSELMTIDDYYIYKSCWARGMWLGNDFCWSLGIRNFHMKNHLRILSHKFTLFFNFNEIFLV